MSETGNKTDLIELTKDIAYAAIDSNKYDPVRIVDWCADVVRIIRDSEKIKAED